MAKVGNSSCLRTKTKINVVVYMSLWKRLTLIICLWFHYHREKLNQSHQLNKLVSWVQTCEYAHCAQLTERIVTSGQFWLISGCETVETCHKHPFTFLSLPFFFFSLLIICSFYILFPHYIFALFPLGSATPAQQFPTGWTKFYFFYFLQ